MATVIDFQVLGGKEFERILRSLPKGAARRVISPALREGAKIVAAQAKREVPKRTGALQRSIRVRAGAYSRRGKVQMLAMTGDGFFKGDTYYGGFVHLGHKIGPRKLGNARAEVQADPFLTRASDIVEQEVVQRVSSRIKNGVIAEAFKT